MQTWMRARLVRRRLWFAVASVLAMLLLLVLVTWPDRARDLPPPPLSEEIEHSEENSPAQRAPSRAPALEAARIPDAATREAAEAGDIEAMSLLGRMFAECREWTSLRSEEVDRLMVDLIEFVSQPGAQGPLVGIASSADGSLEDLLHGMDAIQARCSALDLPESSADRIAQALVWLEAAARAGDHSAMVAWSEHVFRRWPSRAELLDDIDAVRAAGREHHVRLFGPPGG